MRFEFESKNSTRLYSMQQMRKKNPEPIWIIVDSDRSVMWGDAGIDYLVVWNSPSTGL